MTPALGVLAPAPWQRASHATAHNIISLSNY